MYFHCLGTAERVQTRFPRFYGRCRVSAETSVEVEIKEKVAKPLMR
jgi:hypothetical protein